MLIKTKTPHSLQNEPVNDEFPAFDHSTQQSEEAVITDVDNIPSKSVYRQPDLRRVDERMEKNLRFETESNIQLEY